MKLKKDKEVALAIKVTALELAPESMFPLNDTGDSVFPGENKK